MSVAAAIRHMLSVGLTIEQALVAAEAFEHQEPAPKPRSAGAIRQQRYRDRKASLVTSCDATGVTTVTTVTGVTVSPVSPPRDNINSTPLFPPSLVVSEANASLVDGTVDVGLSGIEKQKKKALREELQSLGEQWNGLAAAFRLPTIEEIKPGSKRERHALARLREMPPNGVQALMSRIRSSPYLRGEVNGFCCTFDWMVNATNYPKIMDGNYEDRKISHFRR
jgi:hypothetical protein